MQKNMDSLLLIFPDGIAQCAAYAKSTDEMLLSLIPENPPYTLLAVGGLGRSEQGIHSDLDLLFLADSKESEASVLDLLKKLWDLDYKVGYSVRSLENIWQHAREDITFFTTLIFSRFIKGSREDYRKFCAEKEVFLKKNRGFFFSLLYPEIKSLSYLEKERSILLNQPYLKNSYGGLRGFQTFLWFMELYPEYRFLKDRESYQRARQGYSYLWAVRNTASYVAARSVDQLSLEVLEKIMLHFQMKNTFEVEDFLKKVFYAASDIYDLMLELKENVREQLPFHKKVSSFFKKKKEETTLSVIDRKVYVTEESVSAYLKAVLYAVRSGFEMSESSLRQARVFFSSSQSLSAADLAVFQEFFKLESGLYTAFYTLHLMGFLSVFLPCYREMLFRPQLDFYHSFTLGQHSLLTLKFLSRYFKDQESLFSRVLTELSESDKETLIYALLLHDLGKIEEGNHIENNRRMIDAVLDPLPLKKEQKEDIAFLVIQHLVMSNTCQREDLNRVKVILSFAGKMEHLRRLKLLFLLTACDIQAVNDSDIPSFMEAHLISLYLKTSIVLSEGETVIMTEQEREQIKASLKSKFKGPSEDLLDLFPDDYLIDSENEEILKDMQMVREGKPEIFIDQNKETVRVKFFGPDGEGILSRMVASLTLHRLNITESRVYTLKNGMILDYFFCRCLDSQRVLSESDKKEIREQSFETLKSADTQKLKKSFHNKLYYWVKKTSLASIETQVRIQALEDGLIYFYVVTRDFPGVLYFITHFLHKEGFSVQKAKINTIGLRVHDAFYTSRHGGSKSFDQLSSEFSAYLDEIRQEFIPQSL